MRLVVRALARRLAILAAVLATVVPLTLYEAATVALPLPADQGMFVSIGKLINRGGVPWRDAWENKPPGTYYLYSAVLALVPEYSERCVFTGASLPRDGFRPRCAQIALSVFDGLYALATAAALWWIGRRLFGVAAGVLAAVLFTFFRGMLPLIYVGGVPDTYVLLPSTLAYAAVLRYADTAAWRWLALAGAMAASAALVKQTGGLTLAAIAGWRILIALRGSERKSAHVRWLGELAALGGGAAAIFGATAAVFWSVGVLPDLIDQALLWYRFYLFSPAGEHSVLRVALVRSWHTFIESQAGLWLAAMGGLLLLPTAARREPRLWLLAAWVAVTAIGMGIGGNRFYPAYYATFIPVFSLLGAWALAQLWRLAQPWWRVWLAGVCTGVLLLGVQPHAQQLLRAWHLRILSETWTADEHVSEQVRAGPAGSLYVWGNEAQVYALSGRPPASRFLHSAALSDYFAYQDTLARNRAELIASLEANRPVYIAIDGGFREDGRQTDFPALAALLARDYEQVSDDANPVLQGWRIYRNKAPL